MKNTIKLFTLMTFMSTNLFSQNKTMTEKDLVTQTIHLYFDGWATGDTIKISKAMHKTCHLKFFRDGQFTDRDKKTYLSPFKLRERDKSLMTRILSLDITDNIASAKTEIINNEFIFTDYFNLIKTDEGWCIVDKVSVRKNKI